MKQTKGFLKREFLADKSFVVVGIKRDTLVRLGEVEEQLEENQREGVRKTFPLQKENLMR